MSDSVTTELTAIDRLRIDVLTKVMGWTRYVQPERTQEYGLERGRVIPASIALFKKDPYAIGWKPDQLRPYTDADAGLAYDQGQGYLPDPTDDLAEAWDVVEQMKSLGYVCDIGTSLPDSNAGGKVSCFFWFPKGVRPHAVEMADDPAEAICRAALKAISG